MFFGCTLLPGSKETKLASIDPESSPSADENTGIICPYSHFQWCGFFQGPWVSFGKTDEFSGRVPKLLQKLVSLGLTAYLSVFNLFLTQ